ncbi:hypothetical protein IFM60648_09949 [Aspergillus lentulus]|uniref:Zn(2)-C6 fungal-type domain-containing protein n=1 Tax=Aspergillus lentulus TaxID=293939 RepID=A0ABQ1B479_ASPLE|nr:hypothetical protein IFM60648_09949 [Aspergillus lentulus]
MDVDPLKCGQQMPECLQCSRSNRICPGYKRDYVFVEVDPAAKAIQPTPQQNLALIQTSHHQQLLNYFCCHCVPDTKGPFGGRPWLSQLPQMPIDTGALKASTLALCTALVGRSTGNKALVHESLKLYTRGLRALQVALQSSSLVRHDETLAACLVLAMYEITECPARHIVGYYQHCRGLLSLIQLRGVGAHASGLGHQLFLAIRVHLLKPSFLAEPSWMDKPWQNAAKRPYDRIVECMAFAPRLFHQLNIYTRLPYAEKVPLMSRLLKEFEFLDTTLQVIYKEIKDTVSGPMYWSILSKDSGCAGNPMKGPVFPVAFQFPDLKTAANLMVLWATSSLLRRGWNAAYKDLRQGSYSEIMVVPREVTSVVTKVCQSAEFCLNETNLMFGGFVASMPLAICKAALQGDGLHDWRVAWITGVLETLQHRGTGIHGMVEGIIPVIPRIFSTQWKSSLLHCSNIGWADYLSDGITDDLLHERIERERNDRNRGTKREEKTTRMLPLK